MYVPRGVRVHPGCVGECVRVYTQFPSTDFPSQDIFQGLGCQETFLLIGSLMAALRCSKGWVRKDLNLVMGIGCRDVTAGEFLVVHRCASPTFVPASEGDGESY